MPMFDPQINSNSAQTLADLMGGGSAAQYLGMQQAMQQEMNPINQQLSLADLTKINQENDLFKQKMPNEVDVSNALGREARSKTDSFYNWQRQGEIGDSRTKIAKAALEEGTLEGNIASKNSDSHTKRIQNMGHDMLNVMAYVGNIPDPVERQTAMRQLITAHGWDTNPETKGIWERLAAHPDLIKHGNQLAEQLMNFDPKLRGELLKGREHNASQEKIGAGHDAATRYSADSRAKDYDREMELAQVKQKLEQRFMELTQKEAQGVATPQEKQERMMLRNYVMDKAAAGALVGDQRTRELFNGGVQPPVPNGNGTGGAVGAPKVWDPTTGKWK